MKPPKTRNNGQWTEARFQSFIKSLLRKGTLRWGPVQSARKGANVSRGKYICAVCSSIVSPTLNGKKNVAVDHIIPVVGVEEGFTTWDNYIERMFCEEENLQLICSDCHDKKTKAEREARKNAKQSKT